MDIRSIHRGQTIEWEGKARLCVYARNDFNDTGRVVSFADGLVLSGDIFAVPEMGTDSWEPIEVYAAFEDETLATGD